MLNRLETVFEESGQFNTAQLGRRVSEQPVHDPTSRDPVAGKPTRVGLATHLLDRKGRSREGYRS